MDDTVKVVRVLGDPTHERLEVVGRRHVELDHGRRGRQPPGYRLGQAELAAERRKHDIGALLLRQPRHVEGDGAVGEHTGDEELLTVKQTHELTFVRYGWNEQMERAAETSGVEDEGRA